MPLPGVPGVAVTGPEWSIPSSVTETAAPESGAGFGQVLAKQLSALTDTQTEAASAARQLADGTAADPAAAIVAVERAQLSMQLASQLRTKGVDAFREIMQTQV